MPDHPPTDPLDPDAHPATVDPPADLHATVDDLRRRVARLEAGQRPLARRTATDTDVVEGLLADLRGDGSEPGEPTVLYAGVGPWEDGTVAWQLGRTWGEATSRADDRSARVLAALANPTRLRIVAVLLTGPLPTGRLAERLDQPSSGQLFHHLKDLLAAGIVHQPERGVYAIDRNHVVPLLAVLSATIDLAAGADAVDERAPS
ncbi:MAG: metalloregulator ArsR/SmtB family transcription factor [Actinomycetota bacterium]|nr:metalloregulator ArsR/SmtB family transcription factor [Actinomycetota bacterium]